MERVPATNIGLMYVCPETKETTYADLKNIINIHPEKFNAGGINQQMVVVTVKCKKCGEEHEIDLDNVLPLGG